MKIHLILEGGGMRGAYTAGVLDCFLEHEIYFENIIGVSAGAANATGYISKENKRTINTLLKYSTDKRYISYRSLIKNGSIFGMDFIFKEIPHNLMPFDYETFNNSGVNFEVVTTNCVTGKPHYHKVSNLNEQIDYVIASSSLPVVSPIVKIDDLELLDGGIADPLPIKYSLEQGYDFQVIVLTRNRGYRKKRNRLSKLIRIQYLRYPNLINVISTRHLIYNESLEIIDDLEKKSRAIVVAPSKTINIDRIEKDPEKLAQLYEMGYNDATLKVDQIKKILDKINGGKQWKYF